MLHVHSGHHLLCLLSSLHKYKYRYNDKDKDIMGCCSYKVSSSSVFLCVFCPTAIHDISKCLVIWLHTPWPPHETASSVGCKVFCLIVEVLKRMLCLRQNDDVCDGSGRSSELHRCNVIGCTNAAGEVATKHQLYYWETNWLILDNDDHLV